MALLRVYAKKGKLNYKEKRMVDALTKKLQAEGIDSTSFNPASDFSQLETLYSEHFATDAEFTEVAEPGDKQTFEASKDFDFDDSVHFDPLSSQEPVVRDYVMNNDGISDPSIVTQDAKTVFNEPTTWNESFEMPTPEDEGETSKPGKKGETSGGYKAEKFEKKPPINPNFDEQSNAKKRKSTKKMARAIVHGVCKLAEVGCVWWVTKDITEDKLVEYEMKDTMDLQLLLSLDGNQQITVRNWFAAQVKTANDILKIEEPEKEDLIDSLFEVMMEKGIAPTPMQELIINAVSTIVIGLGVKAFAMSQQINGVLTQLITMHRETKEAMAEEQKREAEQNSQPIPTPTESVATTELATTTE
jgi:hypothetical protein